MSRALVKICGVRTSADLRLLAEAGADLAGVWCGVPGGAADLPPRQAAALLAGGPPQPVLVTLRGNGLPELVDRTGARWVQLHGHQPPGLVRALKARGVHVIKALHVHGTRCLQEDLVAAYERAGTDWFLLDSSTSDGRLGSTGRAADPAALARIADRLHRPFLVAGGITATGAAALGAVTEHPWFRGVDADSAARDASGALDAGAVARLVGTWTRP
ncbi:phosphoribosylanthranilate isomerase [Saccharopolyspora sp. 5N708]|uniref:phosphoribosylanthranilate isomerase n=1 Tax=Saccharopolyspora sp. 5N708 TaxID=3457424 RepID=UPI003FD03151